jgi:Lrp/AsnC family transcriptional regulator, regulator for asnA, asnC and gidA
LSALDLLDRQIMQILNQDARTSSAEIARQVGIPERTVYHRIKRLVDGGYMKSVAIINSKAFGFTLAVDIFCEIEVGQVDQATDALKAMPEISYIALSTGDQDLSIQALFKDIEEMEAFITRKLPQVPGIRRSRTVLLPRILKDTHQWLPPVESFSSGKNGVDQPGKVDQGEGIEQGEQ